MLTTSRVGMKRPSSRQNCFQEMAVDQLVSYLLARSGLGVSWDKLLVVATHVKLAKRFAQCRAERGVKASAEVVSLGVDLSAGRLGGRAKQRATLKLLTRRAREVEAPAIALGQSPFFVSGGALASMKYGVSVVGLGEARLALATCEAGCESNSDSV